MEPVVIPLADPFEIQGHKVAEVTMRPPHVQEYLLAAGKPTHGGREAEMVRLCCGVSEAVLVRISYRDFLEMLRTFGGFTRRPAELGESAGRSSGSSA